MGLWLSFSVFLSPDRCLSSRNLGFLQPLFARVKGTLSRLRSNVPALTRGSRSEHVLHQQAGVRYRPYPVAVVTMQGCRVVSQQVGHLFDPCAGVDKE